MDARVYWESAVAAESSRAWAGERCGFGYLTWVIFSWVLVDISISIS